MTVLKDYLSRMSVIRRSAAGVKETSYYGTLEALFNEVGKSLKPKVRCVINLANKGAGIPDGGLFTPDQFQKSSNDLIDGQLPGRGAIEIKGTDEQVDLVKDTTQVARYLGKYGQVLVTNYHDFLLVTLDENKAPKALERYSIAEDETAFWQKADGYAASTGAENERLIEFLKRVMLHRAPLAKPEDVAWFLASYARDAKARIEESELSALATIRKALEESLGIKFDGEKGEHFFRSTLVQTLFYGIFSAWVLWHKRGAGARTGSGSDRVLFDWRKAVWELRVPMISVLFEQIATPSNLKQLDLVEVLDWTENVLNRVVREEFFARFAEEHAVQYFYEPFLQAFDPELRKELGVWYTPSEIVRYMVERVDRVLRVELSLPDGLADESVYVLDPACGTGAYLVEVLRRINQTLTEKGEDSIRGQKLKKAVMSRVFGFEILPAPFVVSHLQIGLLLEQLGVGFSDDKKERAGVYLTNSLTGWVAITKDADAESKEMKDYKKVSFPEFDDERNMAGKVKNKEPILVILGNPPYNAFAGRVSTEEEKGLIEPYKEGLNKPQKDGGWGIKKFNLDELYVRFFRLAERKIAEQTGKGIVCFISSFSYLRDPSFVVMRQKLLSDFDKIWIDSLNGDSRETGKLTPEGKPDPSIFSTETNREGIRLGTSIGLLLRKEMSTEGCEVNYREFWGTDKRRELMVSLDSNEPEYSKGAPEKFNQFSFRSSKISAAYQSWIRIDELSELSPSLGILENRKDSLISIDLDRLRERTSTYYDKTVTWDEILKLNLGLTKDAARFDAKLARLRVLKEDEYSEANYRKILIRPMDNRWCYHHPKIRPIWNEPRPNYSKQSWDGNFSLVTRKKGASSPEGSPFFFTSVIGFQHSINTDAYFVPIRLKVFEEKRAEKQDNLFGEAIDRTMANLSKFAREYLISLGFSEIDGDFETATLVWFHALAIGFSPEYLTENAEGVRQDFPRIPLPANRDDLIASAELGRRVAALLDTEKPVAGVTGGTPRPELFTIGVASHVGGGQWQDDDFKVTAGWGHGGKDGVTMPGKGKVERRAGSQAETEARAKNPVAIAPGSDRTKTPVATALGTDTTLDIYLNNHAYWRNVPERVWNYYIGGYQVMKKWLSYREFTLLGRPLSYQEVEEVTNMTRRIAALILMESELNENYQTIKENVYESSTE